MKNTKELLRITGTVLFLILFMLPDIKGQEGFSYQAVARDASGNLLTTQDLSIRLVIHAGDASGEVVWQEDHDIQTNQLGLFSLVVGGQDGYNQSGSAETFSAIDWSQELYLKVWVKIDNDFQDMGGSSIQTVPVAKFAGSAKSSAGNFSVRSNQEAGPGEALFEVKRSDGSTAFAVYEDMVWVYVDTTLNKGVKGGFAVGGYSKTKGPADEYLRVTPDSIRFYINTDIGTKGVKGGFAVGGYSKTKAVEDQYLYVSGSSDVDIVDNKAQILWYPKKEAFLAGNIHVGSVDSVGLNSTAMGHQSIAMGNFSQAFGYKSMALGLNTTAVGNKAIAEGNDSYAFGSGALALGERSFAFGSIGLNEDGTTNEIPTLASGHFSVALGMGAQAMEKGAMALGVGAISDGYSSTSMGFEARSTNSYSVAIGYGTLASGLYSTAIGFKANAVGDKSLALGAYYDYTYYRFTFDPITGMFKFIPVTISRNNIAEGEYSIAIGNGNLAQRGGIAFGNNNSAISQGALALGQSNSADSAFTIAAGSNNHAWGYNAVAIGENLIAQSINCFVIGTNNFYEGSQTDWNLADPLFVIGNGTTDRSNAMVVRKSGNTEINGSLRAIGSIYFPASYNQTVTASPRALYIDNTGRLGYLSSSIRYKENIEIMDDISWLFDLNPVTFTYKEDPYSVPRIGLIAEEVKEVNPFFVSFDNEGKPQTVLYDQLITPLLKAIQVQNAENNSLKEEIRALEEKNRELSDRMTILESKIAVLIDK